MALTIKGFGPPVTGFTWGQRFASLPPTLPIVAVVVIIIFFVYNPFGDAWGTPTEGGAIGAFIVFCMALYKGMRWPELKSALIETAKLSVMIFSIIWGVLIYVRFLGFADLPGVFSDWITSLEMAPMLILVYPFGLCRSGHVHGRDWHVVADTSGGLSGCHGVERRPGRIRCRQHIRHVRDDVRCVVRDSGGKNGRVLSDYTADRPQLLCRSRCAR